MSKHPDPKGTALVAPRRGFALLEIHKLQISNHKYQTIFNSAVVAKRLLWRSRLNEIRNSKPCFVLIGFGH